MALQVSPYISFNGNCREAMDFYKSCFGGTLTLQTVEESPMADQWPAEAQKNILHASLQKGKILLLASDIGGTKHDGNTVSLAVKCSHDSEIKSIFTRLSRGGKVTHDLHKFYDGTIGALTDKFGINWILKL
jgi:PhnB protein